MSTTRITVLFFGQLAEHTGVSSASLSNFPDIDSVMSELNSKYPVLAQQHYQVALDKEIIHDNIALSGEHILALLPPYAGG
ncbi:MAG: MoaD/ThiS family protein [Saprospiraceae bacterium]